MNQHAELTTIEPRTTGRVANRVAIVTGGGGGLGQASALRLAEEGAAIVAIDIDVPGLEETKATIEQGGGRCAIMPGDVTEEKAAQGVAALARSSFGPVDILVNVVGGGVSGHIWETDVAQWDAIIARNMRSAFLCTRAVVGEMMERRYGRIICMSSGARDGTPWISKHMGNAAYGASKAGIHGFVRNIAIELGEYGITVNSVSPGPIPTRNTGPHLMNMTGLDYDPLKLIPLGRLGEPIDIANAVLYLASDEAKYVSGISLDVRGGR